MHLTTPTQACASPPQRLRWWPVVNARAWAPIDAVACGV